MTVSGWNTLRDLALGLLVLIIIGAAGLLWLSWVQVGWKLDVARAAGVGMTERDLAVRLGPPTLRISGPDDPRATELEWGGYWTPRRELTGTVLVWQMRDNVPPAWLWRLHVYLDEDGAAECVSLGNT
ncbi:MAG: hypothetical protein ACQER1_11110 [Armatimonadota bacterium]